MPMFSLDFGSRKSSDVSKKARSNSEDSLQGSLKDRYGQPFYRSAVEAKGRVDFGELELELWDSRYNMFRKTKYGGSKRSGVCKPSCIPISIILILIILVVVLSILDQRWEDLRREEMLLQKTQLQECRASCRMTIVESIPEGLVFNSSESHLSTYDAWVRLLNLAEKEIDIGSLYWSLQGKDYDHPTAAEGKDIFKRIMEAGVERKIKIRIAQSIDTRSFPNYDTKDLEKAGAAEVREVNFTRLMGTGILHTKMWVVDQKHAFVGSANFDWRSLTQVKELGILVTNCTCFAKDLQKIFDVYWELGQNDSEIPSTWPPSLDTKFGKGNPMNIAFNGTPSNTYLSSSPPPFCPTGRTTDIDAILDVIDNSTQFVHVAVMDYFPALIYSPHHSYWPVIDDRLRSAAIDRKVKVKLLMSIWNHTRPSAYYFLHSLQDLNNVYPFVDIQIKLFEVPSTPDQAKIPFARVNHNKYMVTDEAVYIGTSNWSGDYFISTGGVGVIISNAGNSSTDDADVRTQVKNIFDRDWNSAYAFALQSGGSVNCAARLRSIMYFPNETLEGEKAEDAITTAVANTKEAFALKEGDQIQCYKSGIGDSSGKSLLRTEEEATVISENIQTLSPSFRMNAEEEHADPTKDESKIDLVSMTPPRPKSIRNLPDAVIPAKKTEEPISDEEDEEEESEYQPNPMAKIEGRFMYNKDVPFDLDKFEGLSSDSDDSNLDFNDEEFEDLSYEELAHYMALEMLESEHVFPDLSNVASACDEEIRRALVKKRWRENLLDHKRAQLKAHAKLTCNPGIHRPGYRMYQAEDYEGLPTTPEIKELFQYITMYSPPTSQVDVKLKPFIPEFYPSVGDIDAFLKVIHPEIGKDNLGIKVLDEPCAFQSDPSVLDLRLRAMAKQSSAKAVVVKKLENVSKNAKVIENWIKDISDLHRSKPSPSIHYSKPMPDMDQLLQEWPPELEKLLSTVKLPPPDLDCDLKTYVDIVCNILDIPVYKSRIQSLHVLATLYLTQKSFGNYSTGANAMLGKDGSGMRRDDGVDRLELE